MSELNNITGTGLLALDIILNGSKKTPPKFQAGGSFGNVLTILSYLGFNTFPISRLANNKVTDLLLEDIEKWNVNVNFIFRENRGSTPIIIHRILKDKKGKPKHKFEFKNPNNGKWLPSFKPFLSKNVEFIKNDIPNSNLYYFDRVSRSSIDLAKILKEKGSIIYFEPSSHKNEKQFKEAIENSDIIKFSNDRIKNYKELYPKANSILEIETLGASGINYRFKSDKWNSLKPYLLSNIVDAAGAGDWCSAGIIKKICSNGPIENQSKEQIEEAINYGQALGAINCLFDGARGAMYNKSFPEFELLVSDFINNEKDELLVDTKSLRNNYTYEDVEELFDSI